MKGAANNNDTMRTILGASARDVTPEMADFIINYLHKQFSVWDGENSAPSVIEIVQTRELAKELKKSVNITAENVNQLRRRVNELELKVAMLDTENLDLTESVTNLENENTGLKDVIKELKDDNSGLKGSNKLLMERMTSLESLHRVSVMRMIIQDLNQIFSLQNFFFKNNKKLSKEIYLLDQDRVSNVHFVLVDPKIDKPVLLGLYESSNYLYDSPSTLCLKISLIRKFILDKENFPLDIAKGLGTELIEGVRSYLESELTEDMLKPKDNVQQEEREEVSKHLKKFFNVVPEFTKLLSGAVEILSKWRINFTKNLAQIICSVKILLYSLNKFYNNAVH